MWHRFIADIGACYRWQNVAWQVLAVALTYIIVVSGFDWWWFTHTRDPLLQSWLFSAAVVGGLLPILLPVVLWIAKKRTAAFAIAEAALIGFGISSFYKVFTGRIPPPFHLQSFVDISQQFEFGFLRAGAFWGWPSSHTTVAFAVAVTLCILYRHNRLIVFGALLVAFYIGIGVSTNIHWFSEFVAGAIIGSVIGRVVGKGWYNRTISN